MAKTKKITLYILSLLALLVLISSASGAGRQYNPALGRFIQPDPKIPDVYNPQSLNRYSYALNNPMKYTDPTGNEHVTTETGTVDKVSKKLEEIIAELKKTNPSATAQDAYKAMYAYYDTPQYRDDGVPRYVYTENQGWIDFKHYFSAAGESGTWTEGVTDAGGYVVEVGQIFNGALWSTTQKGPAGGNSAFSIEDIPSNAAGASAGSDSAKLDADKANEIFNNQMKDLKATTPEADPNYEKLKDTESIWYGDRAYKLPWVFPTKAPSWWQ